MYRVGIGYDLHPLAPGRALILGGVNIPYSFGLAGHSDADVLIHALIDALLGAAGLKDIGHYFPPSDERYCSASSIDLLKRIGALLEEERYALVNADTLLIAQEPRLAPHIDQMVDNMASALKVVRDQISVKATTTEGLGTCGRGEAIAAQAVVLIKAVPAPDLY